LNAGQQSRPTQAPASASRRSGAAEHAQPEAPKSPAPATPPVQTTAPGLTRSGVKLAPEEFALMGRYVEEQCGVSLPQEKAYLLEARLTELLGEMGCRTFHELYRKARDESGNVIRDRIIDAITTRETYWFRDETPFAILRDAVLKGLAEEFAAGRHARGRIWCAGCATGQEPYSVAIAVQEYARQHAGLHAEQVEIVASDVSPTALFVARAARYSDFDMGRGLDGDLRERYFVRQGTVWQLRDSVKNMVSFFRHNLQDPLLPLGQLDAVFCRNVLIYFAEQLKRDVFQRVHGALRRGGALILGSAESVSRYSERFEFTRFGSGMYYRAR
jgi:chemotaxis protein methyltransferase CheR